MTPNKQHLRNILLLLVLCYFSNAVLGQTYDLAQYVIPTGACAAPSKPGSMNNGDLYQVLPAGIGSDGNGHFFVIKSSDGTGYEQWAVNWNYLLIYQDTTWAWENNQGIPCNSGQCQWCDTVCGDSNMNNECYQQWYGDQADFAYTSYQNTSYYPGALWFPRYITMGTTYSYDFNVVAQQDSNCQNCECNLAGSTSHSLVAQYHSSWGGWNDVIEVDITGGAGSGESYFYSQGPGWIGFNGVPSPSGTSYPNGATPQGNCAFYSPGNICSFGLPS